jgi:hypothetical protein
MATAEHREPCDSRGSCTVLGAPGGEIPPGDPTAASGTACGTGKIPLPVGARKNPGSPSHTAAVFGKDRRQRRVGIPVVSRRACGGRGSFRSIDRRSVAALYGAFNARPPRFGNRQARQRAGGRARGTAQAEPRCGIRGLTVLVPGGGPKRWLHVILNAGANRVRGRAAVRDFAGVLGRRGCRGQQRGDTRTKPELGRLEYREHRSS